MKSFLALFWQNCRVLFPRIMNGIMRKMEKENPTKQQFVLRKIENNMEAGEDHLGDPRRRHVKASRHHTISLFAHYKLLCLPGLET